MKISLVIASRGRPNHLSRLLKALRFQREAAFEVIVVSDLPPETVASLAPETCRPRFVSCGQANVSKARNLGVEASGGEIVAFCDDDAVPEPRWLARLAHGFTDPEVHSACGFTRGRNGVSYQWKAMEIDGYGNDHPLEIAHAQKRQEPIKTVGTNMAFRKSALVEVGGFDEAYRFFLDDADLNMRLARLGGATWVDPEAEVQHAFAPSNQRHPNRVPKTLFEIGASKAFFCHQHGGVERLQTEIEEFRAAQSERLARFHNSGLLKGSEVASLLSTLDAGFVEGAQRKSTTSLRNVSGPFQPYRPAGEAPDRYVIGCGLLDAPAKKRKAAALARNGAEVSVVQFIYSPRRLSVRFTDEGYWLHRGGVFGQGPRSDPHFRLSTRWRRIAQEATRMERTRTIDTD